MPIKSKLIDGNLVFYDSAYGHRWLDAWGPGVCKFLEDFAYTPFASADNMAGWTTTLVETGAGETTVALVAGAAGGNLIITTDAAENDGANIQAQGEAFLAASGKELYFGCKFQVSEATQSDFLVGLCITDTDLLGAMTDGIYFRKVDGSTTCNFVLEKGSTETATSAFTVAASTDYTVEFAFNGTNVDFWVNGVKGTRPVTTNLPDTEYLTPSIHCLTGEAVSHSMTIDWIKTIQINT